MGENKNLWFAIVLSLVVMIGSDYLFKAFKVNQDQPRQQPDVASKAIMQTFQDSGSAPTLLIPPTLPTSSPRLAVESPAVEGSFSLKGGVFNHLILKKYQETLEEASPHITLLSPAGHDQPYHAFFRWYTGPGEVVDLKLPDEETVWTADRPVLYPQQPVTLQWDNGQGILFEQIVSIDDHYMFTVIQRVHNRTKTPVFLGTQGSIQRIGTPKTGGFYILHEGPLGVFDGTLKELSYDGLRQSKSQVQKATKGWLGITDKFWLVALVPQPSLKMTGTFRSFLLGETPVYQADFHQPGKTIPPGETLEVKNFLFAGAKELRVLDFYEKSYGIKNFDLAVDFGWFYPLTKPIFHVLGWLKDLTGSFGIALLLLTVLLKALFFPLANRSYRSMSRMRKIQPQIQELKKRFGQDKMRFNQEVMSLYKKEKINPVAGCLPMLVQIPVFFALYKVLFVSLEMRHTPFFGWINDLSAPDPTTLFNLFGLIPWTPPDVLQIGAWPLFMGITMVVQQKLNPPPADPIQAKVFLFVMPTIFTSMLAQFPAGLVIYWAWSNLLSIGQQWIITYLTERPIKKQIM